MMFAAVLFAILFPTTTLATVTQLIMSNYEVTSITCPPHASSQHIRTKGKISFVCWMKAKRRRKINYTFIFRPLFQPKDIGCKRYDKCIGILMGHGNLDIKIEVSFKVKCLFTSLKFEYELKQNRMLVNRGGTTLTVAQPPTAPGYLKLREKNKHYVIEGFINAPFICKQDLTTSKYFNKYEIIAHNCSYSSESMCELYLDQYDRYRVSCRIERNCFITKCYVFVKAIVYGKNMLHLVGQRSPGFTTLIAPDTIIPLQLNIVKKSFDGFIVSFRKPTNCTSILNFVCRVSFNRIGVSNHISSFYSSCENDSSQESCIISLKDLLMGVYYNICFQYPLLLYNISQYSQPYCIKIKTAQLPCQPPQIYNITSFAMDRTFWRGIIVWRGLSEPCWSDTRKYFTLELKEMNQTYVNKNKTLTLHYDVREQTVDYLYFVYNYTFTLSSCNDYGCTTGVTNLVSIKPVERKKTHLTIQPAANLVQHVLLVLSITVFCVGMSSFAWYLNQRLKRVQHVRVSNKKRVLHADISKSLVSVPEGSTLV